jgi:AcrR family transcriptional regulator
MLGWRDDVAAGGRLSRIRSEPSPKRRRSAEETREHVLDVAHHLFYWTGIRATGVDTVAAAAGIAPTALYRLFPSKDALVAAYIGRAERRYREWFDAAATADGGPAERVLRVFAALAEQVRPERCRGCPFSMLLSEFPEPELEAHRIAVRLKRWVRTRFRHLAKELGSASAGGAVDAAQLGDHLTLLFEGVYASVQALGNGGPARRAQKLVAALIGERR